MFMVMGFILLIFRHKLARAAEKYNRLWFHINFRTSLYELSYKIAGGVFIFLGIVLLVGCEMG